MKKKGFGLEWYLLIVAFFLGVVAYYIDFYFAPHKIIDNYIGEYQFLLMKTNSKAEKAIFYIDQSAKYSSPQAAYELAKKGGLSESDCGNYYGYSVWLNKEGHVLKNCNPSEQDIIDNFAEIFDAELLKYLEIYPNALIPADYNYEFGGSLEIDAISKKNLEIDIVPDKFVFKPAITSKNPAEIYSQSQLQVPELLRAPAKKGVDIDTIRQYHPEVLIQYAELCKLMGAVDKFGNPPGICGEKRVKCCITSGYRHPSKNEATKGAAPNSAHLYGLALDLWVGSFNEQIRWAKQIEKAKLFTRVIVYSNSPHLHIDLMPLKGEYTTFFLILDENGKTIASASSSSELEAKAKESRLT